MNCFHGSGRILVKVEMIQSEFGCKPFVHAFTFGLAYLSTSQLVAILPLRSYQLSLGNIKVSANVTSISIPLNI